MELEGLTLHNHWISTVTFSIQSEFIWEFPIFSCLEDLNYSSRFSAQLLVFRLLRCHLLGHTLHRSILRFCYLPLLSHAQSMSNSSLSETSGLFGIHSVSVWPASISCSPPTFAAAIPSVFPPQQMTLTAFCCLFIQKRHVLKLEAFIFLSCLILVACRFRRLQSPGWYFENHLNLLFFDFEELCFHLRGRLMIDLDFC